jgi:hypothetical protein
MQCMYGTDEWLDRAAVLQRSSVHYYYGKLDPSADAVDSAGVEMRAGSWVLM